MFGAIARFETRVWREFPKSPEYGLCAERLTFFRTRQDANRRPRRRIERLKASEKYLHKIPCKKYLQAP